MENSAHLGGHSDHGSLDVSSCYFLRGAVATHPPLSGGESVRARRVSFLDGRPEETPLLVLRPPLFFLLLPCSSVSSSSPSCPNPPSGHFFTERKQTPSQSDLWRVVSSHHNPSPCVCVCLCACVRVCGIYSSCKVKFRFSFHAVETISTRSHVRQFTSQWWLCATI